MPDDVLKISTIIELQGFQQGIPAAADIVERGTTRMASAAEETAKQMAGSTAGTVGSLAAVAQAVDEATKHAEGAKDVWAKLFEGLSHPFNAGNWREFADGAEQLLAHPLRSVGAAAKDTLISLGPIGTLAAVAAAGFAEMGRKAYELVADESNAARTTQNLADRLQLTYEEVKHLSDMAKVAGVGIDILGRVSMRLAEALQNPTGDGKKVAESLKAMGIEAVGSGDALLQLLEHLAKIPNATERIAKAHEIMGRSAVEIQPLLADYDHLSEAVEALGGHLDTEMVGSLLKAHEEITLLSEAWDHFKEKLAAYIAPVVIPIVHQITEIVTSSNTKPLTDAQLGITAKNYTTAAQQMMAEAKANTQNILDETTKSVAGFAVAGMAIVESQQSAAKQAAEAWSQSNQHTVEGIKQTLSTLGPEIKKLGEELGDTGSKRLSTEARAGQQDKYNQKLAEEARLKRELRDAEKHESGRDVGERNAIAAQHIEQAKKIGEIQVQIAEDLAKRKRHLGQSTIDDETNALLAAEAKRYQIELDAATRLNALKASTAAAEHKPAGPGISIEAIGLEHEKRQTDITGRAADERKREDAELATIDAEFEAIRVKGAEKTQAEITKFFAESSKDQIAYSNAVENAAIASATRAADFSRARIEDQFKDHLIDAARRIQLLKDIEEQEYKTALAAAVKEKDDAVKEHGKDTAPAVKAEDKVASVEAKHLASVASLNEQAKHAMTLLQATYKTGMNTVATAFNTGFDQVLNKQKSFAAAMVGSFRGMADSMVLNIMRTMEQALIAAALHDALAKKSVLAAAYGAAANTFHNVTKSGIGGPFNPIIAAAEAAGVMISVMGFSSFEHGGIVPRTQMILAHSGERVLSENQTSRFERAIGAGEAGGASGPTYNYHAAPGESPDSVTRNVQAFRRAIRDGRVRLT